MVTPPWREVPEAAYTAAEREFRRELGIPLLGFPPAAVTVAVDAAAKPIQDAVLKHFATTRQGALLLALAVCTIAVDLALYVGVALFTDGWLRWLAAAAITLTIAIQAFTRWWSRRARRKARVMLPELERPVH